MNNRRGPRFHFQAESRVRSKYSELYEAIALLEPDDPPLRWRVECSGKRSRYNLKHAMHQKFPEGLHIFFHNEEMWVIRLTPKADYAPAIPTR